jgi:hypothetical protein
VKQQSTSRFGANVSSRDSLLKMASVSAGLVLSVVVPSAKAIAADAVPAPDLDKADAPEQVQAAKKGSIAQNVSPAQTAVSVSAPESIAPMIMTETPGEPNPSKVSPVTPTNPVVEAGVSSVSAETYYYNWNDKAGNRGNQVVTPITATYSQGGFDAGVRSAYINSQFRGVKGRGDVSTWSDTELKLGYTAGSAQTSARVGVDMNLPTGRATLGDEEKNAVMKEMLVQQSRFGEGFNIAPGVTVTHALSPNDKVSLGVSHVVKGRFAPGGDFVGDMIDPGNETVAKLQYQKSGKKAQVTGGLTYTHYSATKVDDVDSFRQGDRLDVDLAGTVQVTKSSRLKLAGRYATQAENRTITPGTTLLEKNGDRNGKALFLSADWAIATDKQQRSNLHLLGDYLNVRADTKADPVKPDNFGGNRLSVGLGYDYAFTKDTKAAVQVKYFRVTEVTNSITGDTLRSDGVSVFGSLNHRF